MKRSLLLLAIPFALAAVPTAAAAAQNETQAGLCEPGHGEHTPSRHAHESTPAGKLARSKLQSFAREQRTPCEHGDKCLDKHGACKDCPKQDHAPCTDCDEDCGGRG
ncbi:hypothetical protein [Novosphingobium sp. PC22D]|uniref:hypothetical protein n=1 Tax=Novosphingobium sp. PC22D TaxID=1962403 RepID=UPI0011452A8C|nr:hypothetical protein [Novosphingobium sp. PC22D]